MKGKILAMVLVILGLVFLGGCATTRISDSVIKSAMIKASPEQVSKYMWMEAMKFDPATGKLAVEWFPAITISNLNGQGEGETYNYCLELAGQTLSGAGAGYEVIPNRKNVDKTSGDLIATWTWLRVPDPAGTKLVVIVEYALDLPPGTAIGKELVAEEMDRLVDEMIAIIRQNAEKK